jgi:transposase InsO family protein
MVLPFGLTAGKPTISDGPDYRGDVTRQAIFEYVEVWYNRKRRHSTLGFRSPEEYESSLPIAA